jgi:hypothetical protein
MFYKITRLFKVSKVQKTIIVKKGLTLPKPNLSFVYVSS